MTTTDPELLTEREHHDRARSAMEAMRRSTAEVMGSYEADFVEGRRNRFALGGLSEVVVVPLQHDPRSTVPTHEPIGPRADRFVGEIAGRIARVHRWQEHQPRSHQ